MTEKEMERLWQAFLAGFNESAEGFNGEYRCEYGQSDEDVLKPYFDAWFDRFIGSN